ncbi:energy transducer TonB [Winogradskyella sp. PE311]|uniref:energy transducer TonB n=1 Tax=Winogradskyella sp. PE311 TaxID=3366943 RepID=UPI00397F3AD5
MKRNYSISIPKPCHEDWSKMTENEKGRFCKSCSKTVVDFTKMTTNKIEDYIRNNEDQLICGHIKQSQLNAINLKIPEAIFREYRTFNNCFLLVLLIAMGTTLFTCSDIQGNTKKIDSIEIIETTQNSIDTILKDEIEIEYNQDSIIKKTTKSSKPQITEQPFIDGMMMIETVGEIEIEEVEIKPIESVETDSILIEAIPHCPSPSEDDIVFGLLIIENPPEFINTPNNLTRLEKKDYLSKNVSKIVTDNFNIEVASDLSLKGKQRILTQFKINEEGYIEDIKVRSTHPALEKEAKRVMKLLPQFKPGKQSGKNIATIYSLPIVFLIED